MLQSVSFTPPTLATFKAALSHADEHKHTEIHVDRQGTIRSLRPSWGVRTVRIVTRFFSGRAWLAAPNQKRTINAFREALVRANDSRSVAIVNQRLKEFNAKHRPIDKRFYDKVLKDIHQRNRVEKLDKHHIKRVTQQLIKKHKMGDHMAKPIVDRSIQLMKQRYLSTPQSHFKPLSSDNVKAIVSKAIDAAHLDNTPKAGSFHT
ncbi:MAG: hypothetical protein GDA50_08090 [Alphaproteobacteria bacterium GM202ARS2]|nr:hypothetical protein [Alphaproteobacteria bacterium GM202ARS2]